MKESLTNRLLLSAMLRKDLLLYSRNKVYLFLTLLGLLIFIGVFWLVPDTVEEELTLAISPPLQTMVEDSKELLVDRGLPLGLLEELEELDTAFREEGLLLIELAEETDLRRVISGEAELYLLDSGEKIVYEPGGEAKKPADASKVNLQIGIAFPAAFFGEAVLNQKPQVKVYADAAVPEELRGAMEAFIRELAYQLAGYDLPVELPADEAIILGTDRLGDQISLKSRMRPLIAFFILMMETFAMASLISNEVLQKTVSALLVTPLRVKHFLLSKTIFGTVLALVQGLIVLLFIRAFTPENWSLLLVTIILGSLLFTAVAMLVGSAGKDFIGQLMFSLLFLIPLLIPAFAVLFPGSVATWVKVLPSYPIVDLLYSVTVHNAGWNESLAALGYAGLWVLLIYLAGLFVLKRKVATL